MDKHDTTIYVGNLPWKATEEDLLALFREYGTIVDVRIIQDPVTGRSRGYGFVEFDGADVPQVVASLNGAQFGGRSLMVNLAKPKPERDGQAAVLRRARDSTGRSEEVRKREEPLQQGGESLPCPPASPFARLVGWRARRRRRRAPKE